MQTALTTPSTPRAVPSTPSSPQRDTAGSPTGQNLAHYQIIRRNGAVVPFEPNKIAIAMMKAFLAVHGTQGAASASVRETVDTLTQAVIRAWCARVRAAALSTSKTCRTRSSSA